MLMLEEGQIVMVPKFGAQTVVVEGETYIIASENDVFHSQYATLRKII